MSVQKPKSFQQILMTLDNFWTERGCTLWLPYHESVGAGTANPGTIIRVLGPEPWNVAYAEPSFRPDDGRYADNPNRMQMHIQYQVILQPDPGDPQEQYLDSLYALGIKREEHDIRFVEDNWESPALGAWGLGWEVWLDGMEITQFTYFQQSGGLELDPVPVELTYGLERIAMFLQKVNSVWEIDWDGRLTYGDVLRRQEVEHCIYNFDLADVDVLNERYRMYEAEAKACLEKGLVIPAHDFVLKCSHVFNQLDSRGAVGVTERAGFFARMRDLSRQVAEAYVEQRREMGFPFMKLMPKREKPKVPPPPEAPGAPAPLLLEIGVEELPPGDVYGAIPQLTEGMYELLDSLRLEYDDVGTLSVTPRRLIVYVGDVAPRQADREEVVKGPPEDKAYDADGSPTRAATGFAKGQGVPVEELKVQDIAGGRYVVAVKKIEGRPAPEVLAEALPGLIEKLRFGRSMRWNESGIAFSRPIRWIVALLGDKVIPFEYAGVVSGMVSRGARPDGSPEIEIPSADKYFDAMKEQGITVDLEERKRLVEEGCAKVAAGVGGEIPHDRALLDEVTNLVERPTALLGTFSGDYLRLPEPVLITVMKKHQRYFPVVSKGKDKDKGKLMPYFVAVRNGGDEHMDVVRAGNESVLRARYADADYFFKEDTKGPLESFVPRLETLTFQEKLGSVLDKTRRLEELAPEVGEMLGLSGGDIGALKRAAHLCKADLATQMVVELTSLQGIMGREYALISGEPGPVAVAIEEHYHPRFGGDEPPATPPGIALALADRLDSLVCLFAVGLSPTGSADPYGLRRDALGMVSTLIRREVGFLLRVGAEAAAKLAPVEVMDGIIDEVLAFVQRRLEVVLREEGLRHDVVNAVLAERGDDPYNAARTARDLARWVVKDGWDETLVAYARCKRIVRPIELKIKERYEVKPGDFTVEAERVLWEAYRKAAGGLSRDSSVDGVMDALGSLVGPVNAFFDAVLVMDEDESTRQNRLALVQAVAAIPDGVCDMSLLMGF